MSGCGCGTLVTSDECHDSHMYCKQQRSSIQRANAARRDRRIALTRTPRIMQKAVFKGPRPSNMRVPPFRSRPLQIVCCQKPDFERLRRDAPAAMDVEQVASFYCSCMWVLTYLFKPQFLQYRQLGYQMVDFICEYTEQP